MNNSDQGKKNRWYHGIKVEKKIDLADIIKSLIGLIGAGIIYFSIDMASFKIARNTYELELAKELNSLLPILDNNYTNELNITGDTLLVKVFIRVTSENPVYIHQPEIQILNNSRAISLDSFEVLDGAQSHGIYAAGIDNQITYHIKIDPSLPTDSLKIRMKYLAQVPNIILDGYRTIFENDEWKNLASSLSIPYLYTERVYKSGQNEIWIDFFDDPR